MRSIMIDAGHGGHDAGAVSPSGRREKDLVLDIALRLRDALHGLLRVSMTRVDDTFVSLSERARMANMDKVDLFLSIHCNSADNRQARGFEVWTSPGQTGADPFATSLFQAFERSDPLSPARKNLEDGDPDKEASFSVLVGTSMPAALFELGFLSNDLDEDMLATPSERQRMAEALAEGVTDFLRLDAGGDDEGGFPFDEEFESLLSAIERIREQVSLLSSTLTDQ